MGFRVRARVTVTITVRAKAPARVRDRVRVEELHLANAAVVLEVDLRGGLALGMLRLGLELGVGMTAFR